ncbi:carboxylating nicotinate-nucleotide diphosphorylase [Candidatus Peregrinibacteria bacterium]|jgi:nicotinate-nucleotide pyrophosphorylase (carboxylating)|nr:carboxylating nicotinate-nucleotide diphosphorylase [Candidatus Peregrinibacteria bacterium]MBT7736430.1 carboxylating nicotinate-nucleotide diphosphorylase [Candidatus Peregrinibacteria bacterium]
MDRKALREFTHKVGNFLTVKNSTYKQWVFRYTFLELEKDLGSQGDITTNGIFHDEKIVTGKVYAREDGVLAGREEIEYFLKDSSPNFRPAVKGEFKLDFNFEDGSEFKKDDLLFEMTADVRDLLAVERVVLNLIMRMSGVATYTKKVIDLVKGCDVLVTPTRKTLWGLLDKRAVLLGGGGSHRLNLEDAILIKDTHMDLIDKNYEKAFTNIAATKVEPRFLEIEVGSIENAVKCAEILVDFIDSKRLRTIGVLLMDNMGPENIEKALVKIKKLGLYDKLLFEGSGGVTEDTIVEYAKSGVDIVSLGSITNGPRSLNMSMKTA